jgi:hypothetical protein
MFVPIAIGVPPLAVFVPPPVELAPAAIPFCIQFMPPVVRFWAVPSMVRGGIVQLVIDLLDVVFAAVVVFGARGRCPHERQHAGKCSASQHRLAPKLTPIFNLHDFCTLLGSERLRLEFDPSQKEIPS